MKRKSKSTDSFLDKDYFKKLKGTGIEIRVVAGVDTYTGSDAVKVYATVGDLSFRLAGYSYQSYIDNCQDDYGDGSTTPVIHKFFKNYCYLQDRAAINNNIHVQPANRNNNGIVRITDSHLATYQKPSWFPNAELAIQCMSYALYRLRQLEIENEEEQVVELVVA